MKEIPWMADNQYRSQQGKVPGTTMIQLTRLNQTPIMLNSDLIKFVENAPDTVITLISGEKFVVRESTETIVRLVVDFRRRLLDGLLFNGLSSTTPQTMPKNERHRRMDSSEQED